MTRHRVDATRSIQGIDFARLPETKVIEDAGAEPVAKRDPPMVEVAREPYLPGAPLVEAVDLAIALGRPLLLQGDPGCGKDAAGTRRGLRAGPAAGGVLYQVDHPRKDLLYTYDAVNRLYHAQLGERGPRNEAGDDRLCNDPCPYVRLGPLGRAIARANTGGARSCS